MLGNFALRRGVFSGDDHNYSEVKTEERGWGKKKKEKKPANLKNVVW